MKKSNSVFIFAMILLSFSACKTKQNVATIKSGNNASESNVNYSDGSIKNLTENETFGTYKKDDDYIVEPSGEIVFNLAKKEKVRCNFMWKKRKRGKKHYAFVVVNKYFYKFLWWRPIVGSLAIPLTYGSSLGYLNPSPHKKTQIETEIIENEEYVDRTIYNKQILIETRVWCKKDEINDNVIVVENLPEGITVNSYKVKIKKGKRRIENVSYEEKIIDGETCHVFTIKGNNGILRKKNKVWIILDVTIKPNEKHLID